MGELYEQWNKNCAVRLYFQGISEDPPKLYLRRRKERHTEGMDAGGTNHKESVEKAIRIVVA